MVVWAGPLAGLACAGLTVSASELATVKEGMNNGASALGALFVGGGRGGVRGGGRWKTVKKKRKQVEMQIKEEPTGRREANRV